MGDVFLQYNETGRRYFRRLIYVNILFYILVAIIFVITTVNIVILLLIVFSASIVSIVYAVYFIHKNPPMEYSDELA